MARAPKEMKFADQIEANEPWKIAVGMIQIRREKGENLPSDEEALEAFSRWQAQQEK